MSNLFNTLEQIRRQERFQFRRRPFPVSRPAAKEPARQRSRTTAVLLAVCVLMAGTTLLLRGFHLPSASLLKTNPSRTAPAGGRPADQPRTAAPGKPSISNPGPRRAAPATGSSRAQQMASFNKRGVEAAGRKEYWQAAYFFKRAAELQPGRPEPLINLGVVLIRLDLPIPARRVFEKAYAAAPADPRLRKNLELLAEVGLLGETLAEAAISGTPSGAGG